jgi:RHS repeat-associated protein
MQRLVTSQTAGQAESYEYDAFGNMTKITHAGQATPIAVTTGTNQISTYAYDLSGNVTDVVTNGAPEYTFTYDALGAVAGKTYHGSSGDVWEGYIYTPNDERLAVWRGDSRYWSVRDESGHVLRQYKSSGRMTTAPLLWVEDYVWRDGALLGSVRPAAEGGRRHMHVDHLGTPRLVTSDTGQVVSQHDYFPFGGEATPAVQETAHGFSREAPLKFTSHERDYAGGWGAEDGHAIDYMHARYYSAATGRFLSVDPNIDVKSNLRNPQGWNRYAYAQNNPINRIDPDGRLTIIVAGTWAKDEDWPAKGAFNQAVSQRAVAFRWSGGNTKGARAEAAKQLKAYIQANRKPGEPLNIVAHSHGGNVVKAYTQMQDAQKIDTFIAMGTPQRSDYTINAAKVGDYINVFSNGDNVQTKGDRWWAAAANSAGRTDPAARNIGVTYANASPAGVGHSGLHTPDVLEQVPPQ